MKPIRRAAGIATCNTWAIGIFALPAVLFRLFDPVTLVTGLALSAVAYVEHRGGRGLRALDERAPRWLGWNQLALFGVVIAYAGWRIGEAVVGGGPYDAEMAAHPELAGTLEPLGDMIQFVTVLVYVLVIVCSVIFQGLNAWYYFSRAKCMRRYLKETPDGVVQMQRATG